MKIFLIISGSFLFLSGLFAQNIEETYLFGNKQAELENYDLAIESYRRVLFFDSNYYSLDVSQKLAFCYLQMGQPDKSLQFLDLASNLTSNDSLENEIFFRKVSIYLQSFNYDYALLELESLNNIPTAYFFQKKEFYYGIIYFQKEDYQKSQNHILNSIDSSYTAQRADINNLFNKIDKLKRYNPNTARILSLIIPGMGQLYAGDIKNSLNSFIL